MQAKGALVSTDRVTRFAADLLDSAAAEGARHSRSAKQQLDHWARVGRTVSSHYSSSRRRVEAALEGRVSLTDLTDEERLVANAEIDAAIAERLHSIDFGAVLAAEGVTTVALDDQGRMVRYEPDGTATILGWTAG
jgi:ParD-like antitoxin of type II bacterial toxin-antitoxin system